METLKSKATSLTWDNTPAVWQFKQELRGIGLQGFSLDRSPCSDDEEDAGDAWCSELSFAARESMPSRVQCMEPYGTRNRRGRTSVR